MKNVLFLLIALLITNFGFAEKYYWVGGSGKWSELHHWSPVSGSTSINHGVIPTYNDTVFFDANSFSATNQTVTIDVGHAICMRMDWTGALFQPTLASSGGNNLSIYGSLILSPDMNFNFSGKILFEAISGNHQIITYGKNLNSLIYFNGLAGKWEIDQLTSSFDINQNGLFSEIIMLGNITTTAYIYINAGIFTANQKIITADRFMSGSGTDKTLNIEKTKFFLGTRWLIENTAITLNNNLSEIYLLKSGADFYAGEGNHYYKVHNNVSGGTFRYIGNACSIDSTICDGGIRITGNTNNFAFLSIAGDGIFEGSNTFGKLWLSAQKMYSFESSKTQYITNDLKASGNCEGFTYFYSSASAAATLNKANGNVLLTNMLIENVQAEGGAVFQANASAGLKLTTGWTINNAPRTLYWIGGAGNWNETAHWSLASGGVGGECIPFHTDNVIFDNNSFSTGNEMVEVNTPKAYCKNMYWLTTQGNPKFYTTSQKLRIFASLRLSENMVFDYNGQIYFMSEQTGNTITSASKIYKKELYFAGNGGEWTLQDTLNTDFYNIELQKGKLISNHHAILCKDFVSNNANTRGLVLGNSVVTVANDWQTSSSSNFNFDSGSSLIKLTSGAAVLYGGSELVFHNVLFTDSIGKGTLESGKSRFNKVTFKGNGLLRGITYYDTLQLSQAKVYSLDYAGELNVNTFLGKGSCSGYIVLQSSQIGTRAKIAKPSGSLDVNYFILQDIDACKVTNGFTATNSIDMGNNACCTINSALGQNLYWVGKNGNWADEKNWAYSSGGARGACIPSPVDNVFFDNNSFTASSQTVMVDIAEAYCKSMDWTGSLHTPSLTNLGNSSLFVYGSMTMVENMNWLYYGKVFFETENQAQSITSAGNEFWSDVYFQGTNGVWNLTDSLTVGTTLTLTSGKINTNSHNVNVGNFNSQTSLPSILNAENSLIKIADKWIVSSNFKLTKGNFEIEMLGGLSTMTNNAVDSLFFNDVSFTSRFSDCGLFGTTHTRFKNIYFAGKAEVSGTGHKSMDSLKVEGIGKVMNYNRIVKATFNAYAQIWDNATIDTLLFNSYGDVTGKNTITYFDAKDKVTVTGTNFFQHCKLNGNGDVYGVNTFDTLIFTPDRRYVFQGGKSQKILNEFKIRGNHCRHIYFVSSNNEVAYVEKTAGSVKGDFLEMQSIGGKGGATFYAGNFNHSDNIDNSCVGWIFEDQPGYIYGLDSDTIFILGEQAIINTDNLNGDAETRFVWNTGLEAPQIEITQAGKYTVNAIYGIINGNLCQFQDDIIVHFAKLNQPRCKNENNGSIEIITDNPNYDFLWHDNSTLNPITNLGKGSYWVEVTQKVTNRKASRTFAMPDGLVLEMDITKNNTTCFEKNDGSIQLAMQNGVAPFTYKWLNLGNSEGNQKNNLAAGEYYIELSDAFCVNMDTIVLTKPNKLELNFELKTSCTDAQGGELTAHAKGGTPAYTYHWADFASTNDSVINQLSGEKYIKLMLTDANLCQLTDSVWFSQPAAFVVSIAEKEDERCFEQNNGSLLLSVLGGKANYSFVLDASQTFDNKLIENIAVGLHKIVAKDANNCSSELDFEIKSAPNASITLVPTDEKCSLSNGKIEYTINSSRTINQVLWTGANHQAVANLAALAAGKYYVTFIDSKNCSYNDSTELFTSDCASSLEVPNVFTPNSDGLNDVFVVQANNLVSFSGIIINRWGRQVFAWNNYLEGWNGKLDGKGNEVSSGVYFYLIKAIGEDGQVFNLQGELYLEY